MNLSFLSGALFLIAGIYEFVVAAIGATSAPWGVGALFVVVACVQFAIGAER